jgi:hypothetical protein
MLVAVRYSRVAPVISTVESSSKEPCLNKPTIWLGVAASIATIGGFAYQLFQPSSPPTPTSSSKSATNNNQGINFGKIEQKIEIRESSDKKSEIELVKTIREPTVQHTSKGMIISVQKIINDLGEVEGCGDSFLFPAVIVNRTYAPKNKVRLNGLVVKAKDGVRGFINIDETLYDRLARMDQNLLDDFLAEGRKATVTTFICGQGIGVWHADGISIPQ